MEQISLNGHQNGNFTIMIFAEGTVLKPKSWFTLYRHDTYVPIGNCVQKIKEWQRQGANIVYCTSRKGKQAIQIANLLMKHGFSGVCLYYRNKGEKYKDIVETIRPDILIEDDCRSIGGAWQMCITNVNPAIKDNIVSIAVEEFKGIDQLPQDISKLRFYNK